MSRPVVTQLEPARECAQCGQRKETRPYGRDGARVCFRCAMHTAEDRAIAETLFARRFKGES